MKLIHPSLKSRLSGAGQIAFDVWGQVFASVNTLIGIGLGSVSGGKITFDRRGTILVCGVRPNSPTARLMRLLKARAFTVGYVILTSEKRLDSETYDHELGHVTQYALLGPLFLPIYGLAHLLARQHDRNPLEARLLRRWPKR